MLRNERIGVCSVSGASFQSDSKMLQARSWRERQLSLAEGLQEIVTSLPSCKTSSSAQVLQYAESMTQHLAELTAHYGSIGHRKWRKKVGST